MDGWYYLASETFFHYFQWINEATKRILLWFTMYRKASIDEPVIQSFTIVSILGRQVSVDLKFMCLVYCVQRTYSIIKWEKTTWSAFMNTPKEAFNKSSAWAWLVQLLSITNKPTEIYETQRFTRWHFYGIIAS